MRHRGLEKDKRSQASDRIHHPAINESALEGTYSLRAKEALPEFFAHQESDAPP